MSRVLKANYAGKIQSFNIEQFQGVDRGDRLFEYQFFPSEELSVQDIAKKEAGTRRRKYTLGSPESQVFSIYDNNSPGEQTRVFGEYAYEDGIDRPGYVTGYEMESFEAPETVEESVSFPDESIVGENIGEHTSADNSFAHESAEVSVKKAIPTVDDNLPDDKENEIQRLQAQLAELTAEKERLKNDNEALTTSIEELRKSSYNEGYSAAESTFAQKQSVEYEAKKADYLGIVERELDVVKTEMDKIKEVLHAVDEQMPEIVLSYVKEIIGEERVLNDKFILNVVHSAVEKLNDVQHAVFTVNPDDAGALSGRYPDFGLTVDAALPKGTVKIRTKVGEIDLSVDAWLKELENKINEQLKASQIHKN